MKIGALTLGSFQWVMEKVQMQLNNGDDDDDE